VIEKLPENETKIKCTMLLSAGKGIIAQISVNDVKTSGVIYIGADATVVSSYVPVEEGINTSDCEKYVSSVRKMERI
jgi:hypothetical protein